MNHPGSWAVIALAGIFATFVWPMPVVAAGIVIGGLIRSKEDSRLKMLKEAR